MLTLDTDEILVQNIKEIKFLNSPKHVSLVTKHQKADED